MAHIKKIFTKFIYDRREEYRTKSDMRHVATLVIIMLFSGCASVDPLVLSDKSYTVGEYSVHSVKVTAKSGHPLQKQIAQDVETGLKEKFSYYAHQSKPIRVKVTIHELVDNLDTSQLMLAGGDYYANATVLITTIGGKKIGEYSITVTYGYNTGGLLGVAFEGATNDSDRLQGLKKNLIHDIFHLLYPQAPKN